jgi:hypothetical protein
VLDGWDVEEGDTKTSSGARVVALDAETVKALRTPSLPPIQLHGAATPLWWAVPT